MSSNADGNGNDEKNSSDTGSGNFLHYLDDDGSWKLFEVPDFSELLDREAIEQRERRRFGLPYCHWPARTEAGKRALAEYEKRIAEYEKTIAKKSGTKSQTPNQPK